MKFTIFKMFFMLFLFFAFVFLGLTGIVFLNTSDGHFMGHHSNAVGFLYICMSLVVAWAFAVSSKLK